jgi:rhodanese-related sulfurtransferase
MKTVSFVAAVFALSCASAPAPSPQTASDPSSAPAPGAVASAPAPPEPEADMAPPESGPKLTPCKTTDRISGRDAQALAQAGATLVDVRSPDEFSQQSVPSSRNIPVDDLEQRMTELPKDHPVIVYCRSGKRAARAASILRAAGFTTYNMGGVDAWGKSDC